MSRDVVRWRENLRQIDRKDLMTKLTLQLPADAADRLVALLNSDTPEGDRARADLGVISAKLVDKMVDTVADICDANNGGKQ